jgi:MoxR-like ATPase
VHHAVRDYAVRLVMATREPATWGIAELEPHVSLGASPRATLGLLAAGRALALLRGRRYVTPQDVFDVAPEVLRHRLILTYDALAQGITPDDVVRHIVSTVHAPHVAPRQDEVPNAAPTQSATPPAPTPTQPAGTYQADPNQPWSRAQESA